MTAQRIFNRTTPFLRRNAQTRKRFQEINSPLAHTDEKMQIFQQLLPVAHFGGAPQFSERVERKGLSFTYPSIQDHGHGPSANEYRK
jgi:hypothetical protein